MSATKRLTKNDLNVLTQVRCAQGVWDGFAPHGAREHLAIRRLIAAGLVESIGIAECQSCDEPHDAEGFVTTSEGEDE